MFGGPIRFDPASNLAAQAGLIKALAWCSLDRARPTVGDRERNLAAPLQISADDFARAEMAWLGHDGLEHEWASDWWCNPPFNAKAMRLFLARFDAERIRGSRGIVMLNCDPSNAGQLELLRHCLVAYPLARIGFWMPSGQRLDDNRAAQLLFGVNCTARDWERGMTSLAVLGRPWNGVRRK
ncbi:MAG: hypothetical protein HC927_07895 [Deltaproteobacteria bacterium]|nr:hypothetical protein [Deltaproteobacteria bacterium]